jgi:hypothetical protein
MTTQVWLSDFLTTRRISIKHFSRLLGYKSPTSVARILQGRANAMSVAQLAERFGECRALPLTQEESQALREAVKLDLFGADQYYSNLEMEQLLRGNRPNRGAVQVQNLNDATFCDLQTLYLQANDIHIILLNCRFAPIYGWLSTLIDQRGASVRHLLVPAANVQTAIHGINAITEIVFSPQYAGYVLKPEAMEAMSTRGMLTADALLCAYRDADGQPKEDLITFQNGTRALRKTFAGGQGGLAPFFSVDPSLLGSIKRTFPQCKTLPDYYEFIRQFSALETDRNTYRIKPDICIDIVPTHILKAVGLGGNLPPVEGLAQLIDAFEGLFSARIQNAFTKHRVTHLVMKRGAMRDFVQTGVATDHFWGFRPYTPAERLEIFETLMDQQINNPYFHLNFLKDDDFVRDTELGYYEGLGMLILPEHTPYDLHDRYSEVMITQKDFCEGFKTYYLHYLLRYEVISPQESIAFLREQMKTLQEMLNKGDHCAM